MSCVLLGDGVRRRAFHRLLSGFVVPGFVVPGFVVPGIAAPALAMRALRVSASCLQAACLLAAWRPSALVRAAMLLGCLATTPALADLRILHLDVGMGDATLVVDTGSGQSLLIDAGNRGDGRRVVAPALIALGVDRLDYFLASHYDADHIGGFDELIEAGVTVETVLERPGIKPEVLSPTGRDTQYGEYLAAARAVGARLVELIPDCRPDHPQLRLGADTRIQVAAAGGRHLAGDIGFCEVGEQSLHPRRENARSVALIIEHGRFRYFTGGDLTGGGARSVPMEAFVAAQVGNVDVLKLNHHGSDTSTSDTFVQTLRPEVAVLSVGDGGVNLRYRLPRQAPLDRLAKLSPAPLLFQTRQGEGGSYLGAYVENRHIVVHTDGESYTINGLICVVDERTQASEGGHCR